MSANISDNLIEAIRAGNLEKVVAAIEAGADCDQLDDHGVPGLPLRIACYNGHIDIVRELVRRGADVNPPQSLVALAARGEQKETIRLLLELGAELPSGLHTGLNLREVLAAQGAANRLGRDRQRPGDSAGTKVAADGPAIPQAETPPDDTANDAALPEWTSKVDGEIEEIQLEGCYGVDTNALNAELMRMNPESTEPTQTEPRDLGTPHLDFDKLKFWKK